MMRAKKHPHRLQANQPRKTTDFDVNGTALVKQLVIKQDIVRSCVDLIFNL
jgi:hypothetical protein